jgi:hypothetical protein
MRAARPVLALPGSIGPLPPDRMFGRVKRTSCGLRCRHHESGNNFLAVDSCKTQEICDILRLRWVIPASVLGCRPIAERELRRSNSDKLSAPGSDEFLCLMEECEPGTVQRVLDR